MVRRFKKTTTIFVLSIVALLMLGVGYADWADQLDVDGAVNTAGMNVEWQNLNNYDTLGSGVNCEITRSPNTNGDIGKKANITISGAYPGAKCSFTGDMYNSGDVPVEITDFDYHVEGAAVGEPWETENLTVEDDCTTTLGSGGSITIASNATHTCDVTVEVNDGSDPNAEYDFWAEFTFDVDNPS